EVEILFIPWLLDEMEIELSNKELAYAMVDDLIHNALQKASTRHQEGLEIRRKEAEEEALERALEQQRAKEKEDQERQAKADQQQDSSEEEEEEEEEDEEA